MSLGTRVFTWLHGEHVGTDEFGNRYYLDKRTKGKPRERRWVLYKGIPEATKVPPEWHAWLHYTTDGPLQGPRWPVWMKPHLANVTGTALAYRPPGHDYEGGNRARATGDYEAWTPS